ncbi:MULTISPECIES: ABC transporter permease [unclassified Streptosporangium]|uniref:ABC transporter permease n=1 Tax=unclassified Streptosporangium TaxID=2632669 RepID=UPI002E2E5CBE|nr:MULTISPECIES: ABC transporter permease [unclassified Streptosporangium]
MSELAAWPVMTGRAVRLSLRNLDALFISFLMPVLVMLLFVYLFGGAIQTGVDYVTYAVPGILVMCASYGASLTAVAVSHDMSRGIVDRFRSMDVGGGAFLGGHVAASTVRNLTSLVIVFVVAFLLGFRAEADLAGWAAAVGVLVVFVLAISAVSAVVGLLAKTPEVAGGFTFFVMFLPYPSSAFVPVHTMPAWLHGFAENQPATPIIESVRGLLLGQPVGNDPWKALAWCGGFLLVSAMLSGRLFRRRAR